jgi:hypothetical protein
MKRFFKGVSKPTQTFKGVSVVTRSFIGITHPNLPQKISAPPVPAPAEGAPA